MKKNEYFIDRGVYCFANLYFPSDIQVIHMTTETATMTITLGEYQRLLAKSKSGWKAFYDLFDNIGVMQSARVHVVKEPVEDLTYLKTEFLRMLRQVHQTVSCPVCLEDLDTRQVVVLNCGHILCQDDHTAIIHGPHKMCPTCRRTIRSSS